MTDANSSLKLAKEFGLCDFTKRWEEGIDHHPKSIELYQFIEECNFECQGDSLYLKHGGDGDNGEELLYALDAYFELQDRLRQAARQTPAPQGGWIAELTQEPVAFKVLATDGKGGESISLWNSKESADKLAEKWKDKFATVEVIPLYAHPKTGEKHE